MIASTGGASGVRSLLHRLPDLLTSPLTPWFEFLEALGLQPAEIRVRPTTKDGGASGEII